MKTVSFGYDDMVMRNPEGYPCIAGRYGYSGEVLIGGRVRCCGRIPDLRDITDNDFVFTPNGMKCSAATFVKKQSQ